MRVFKQIIIVLILLVFVFSSCGKKIVPSLGAGKQDKGFDSAAFNYVYVEAIKQKLTGNGGEALKYLEQSIKINPESDAAYYQMAQIVIANGDIVNGKRYAAKALEIEKDNVWYLMMIAGLYYQEKNLDSAIYFYETAVKYYPEKENLLVALGGLYTENNNFERANSIFDLLDSKYGVNETTAIASIQSLVSAKKFDEALEKAIQLTENKPDEVAYKALLAEVYSAKGENDKALEVYKALIEKNPDDPQTLLSLSDFLVREKYYDELFILLNTIILNTRITKEDKVGLFGRLIEIPDLVKNQGDKLMVAIRILEADYSGDNVIPMLRPELLIRQQKLPETAVVLEEIIRKNPENYFAWEKLLIVYLQLGEFKKLMIKGEEAASRFNRSFVAKVLYANGALENGDFKVALDELKKAEILAGDDKANMMQVLTMKADVYYRMKEYGKAFEAFEQALKKDSEDLTTLNNYAYYLAEQNMNLKEAEEMSRKVIETEKDNTTFLDTYAWVLYKRGKLKEAARTMEHIIELGQNPDAEWFEHYGFILKKQEKCEKAIENWNIAVKMDTTKKDLINEIQNCKR